ncbi:MAG: exoribonuclease II [Succinivibrionaceae bacterium]
MFKDNPILMQLKKSNNKHTEGIVKSNEKGFGFLEVSSKESYYISKDNMKFLIHGDKIEAEIIQTDGKYQAIPCKLIDSSLKRFVGRVSFDNNLLYVIPDSPTIKKIFRAKNKVEHSQLLNGDWVIARLISHGWNTKKEHAVDIIEVISQKDNPQIPWLVVLRNLDLPIKPIEDKEFYEFYEKQLSRKDYRSLPFITIDSEKTKDMDDALYIEDSTNGGWRLYVAIADPTGYILENDKIDKYALARSFSIYLPGKNIPMLPFTLSEDLCSLKENVDRNVIVGIIDVNIDGSVDKEIEFSLAVIRSQGKLIYDEVSDYLENKQDGSQYTPKVQEQLIKLQNFCNKRFDYRKENATVYLDKPEYEFILDENGGLQDIKISTRRIANKIVEEAMIVANICAGKYFADRNVNAVYNVHLGFDEEKLNDLIGILEENNIFDFSKDNLLTKEGFARLKREIDSLSSAYLDSRLRKFQKFAEISLTPLPHFGLCSDYYATWTSPIRKYGDMVNHRLIKYLLGYGGFPKNLLDNSKILVNNMILAKKQNKIAERSVKDWLYIDYIEKRKTEVFESEIFDISRSGIRARFLKNGASVFIPIITISEDKKRINADAIKGILKFDNTILYKVGDSIKVKITEINKENRSIIGKIVEK